MQTKYRKYETYTILLIMPPLHQESEFENIKKFDQNTYIIHIDNPTVCM